LAALDKKCARNAFRLWSGNVNVRIVEIEVVMDREQLIAVDIAIGT
jgi:tRNA U34 5-methylaminomethyl-2-thiouridine-forming methyltransferase MnmC